MARNKEKRSKFLFMRRVVLAAVLALITASGAMSQVENHDREWYEHHGYHWHDGRWVREGEGEHHENHDQEWYERHGYHWHDGRWVREGEGEHHENHDREWYERHGYHWHDGRWYREGEGEHQ
jgi:hypothetical protein